ncbi:MAG: SDR family oxidoreductase [Syntrophales bacterium LBB04]|nr:SDR family oxidoreductase [Syntrophales bacterium LBB04]
MKTVLKNLFNFKNKVVLVTGACGQLGFEICEAYVKAEAKVIASDIKIRRRKNLRLKNINYLEMDISDKDSVNRAFKAIYSKFGRLDILINNAGVSVFEPYEDRSSDSFDWVMDVNLKGTFFCIQAFAKYAIEKKYPGSIVNIASMYGLISPDFRIYTDCPRKNSEVYGATKAGIIQMTRYFSVHLAKHGIRVNCVSPGGIFNPDLPQGKDFIKNYSYRCPMGRMAEANEIVGGILYLSSEASTYTTGHNLIIDGGMSCW